MTAGIRTQHIQEADLGLWRMRIDLAKQHKWRMARVIAVTYPARIVTDVVQTRLIDHQDESVVLSPDPDPGIHSPHHVLSREQQLLVHMNP